MAKSLIFEESFVMQQYLTNTYTVYGHGPIYATICYWYKHTYVHIYIYTFVYTYT